MKRIVFCMMVLVLGSALHAMEVAKNDFKAVKQALALDAAMLNVACNLFEKVVPQVYVGHAIHRSTTPDRDCAGKAKHPVDAFDEQENNEENKPFVQKLAGQKSEKDLAAHAFWFDDFE